jgi:excisionase family DNA binding protein
MPSAKARLTVKELCDKLGVHRSTVYRWMNLGLPSYIEYRFRQPVRTFDLEEVNNWLNRRAKGKTNVNK